MMVMMMTRTIIGSNGGGDYSNYQKRSNATYAMFIIKQAYALYSQNYSFLRNGNVNRVAYCSCTPSVG